MNGAGLNGGGMNGAVTGGLNTLQVSRGTRRPAALNPGERPPIDPDAT